MKELQDTDAEGICREAQRQEWRRKQEHHKNVNLLAPRATSNMKHSATTCQVNINPDINDLFALVPITQCMPLFQ